jgi:hypothetical protein
MKVYYDDTFVYQPIYLAHQNEEGQNTQIDHTVFLSMTEEEILEKKCNELELEHTWYYWSHEMDNEDWSEETFEKHFEISTVYELWKVLNYIKNVQLAMHFLVREGTSPCWDNPDNSHLWWIKRRNICGEDALDSWMDLVIAVTGLGVFKDQEHYSDTINNISVSYKDNDYVFKIMMNKDVGDPSLYNNIKIGKDFTFDFVKGGRFIENTGGKKNNENKIKKNYKNCKKISPKKNYRQPLKMVN